MTRRPVLPALLIVVVLLLTIVILLISSSLRPDLPVIHIDEDGPKDDPPAHHLHLRRSPPLHPPPPPPPPPPEVMVAEDPTAGDFHRDVDITFGDGRAKIFDHGRSLTLSMDKYSGSGFRTKNEYLFGKLDMQIKLVPGNSAGTVTTYYLSSEGSAHDEVDFEFLGNLSGDPYTLHTNVFAEGKGNREQQFHLWFDPTKDFHNYSILWNPQHIIFFVDGIPIRDFKNQESKGVPFPKNQPMRIYTSLWDAEEWATRGGKVKTDWNEAPFVAGYRNFIPDACVWSSGASSCSSSSSISSKSWFRYELDSGGQKKMRWVQKNHMVYNYCADFNRFAQEMPPECSGSS